MSERRRFLRMVLVVGAAVLSVAAAAVLAFGRGHSSAGSARAAAKTSSSPNAGIVVIQTGLGYEDGSAAGTGMVLTSSGEVLTNNHVIAGATTIRVVVPGTGRTLRGERRRLRRERRRRGAPAPAERPGSTTVRIGDSSTLSVGQAVHAVGNAGGTGSLTTAPGTVTGLGQLDHRLDRERALGAADRPRGDERRDSARRLRRAAARLLRPRGRNGHGGLHERRRLRVLRLGDSDVVRDPDQPGALDRAADRGGRLVRDRARRRHRVPRRPGRVRRRPRGRRLGQRSRKGRPGRGRHDRGDRRTEGSSQPTRSPPRSAARGPATRSR